MTFRIFKVIWIISLIAVCGVFFYTYSSLQDVVQIDQAELIISKTAFFYFFILLLAIFNGVAFGIGKFLQQSWKLCWFYGMLTCLHLFLSATFIFLAILNSNERYDYAKLGPTVIGSLTLFVLWVVSFPLIPVFQKRSSSW